MCTYLKMNHFLEPLNCTETKEFFLIVFSYFWIASMFSFVPCKLVCLYYCFFAYGNCKRARKSKTKKVERKYNDGYVQLETNAIHIHLYNTHLPTSSSSVHLCNYIVWGRAKPSYIKLILYIMEILHSTNQYLIYLSFTIYIYYNFTSIRMFDIDVSAKDNSIKGRCLLCSISMKMYKTNLMYGHLDSHLKI